jgi:hypothetical protein
VGTDVAVVKVDQRSKLKTAVLGMDTPLQLGEPTDRHRVHAGEGRHHPKRVGSGLISGRGSTAGATDEEGSNDARVIQRPNVPGVASAVRRAC